MKGSSMRSGLALEIEELTADILGRQGEHPRSRACSSRREWSIRCPPRRPVRMGARSRHRCTRPDRHVPIIDVLSERAHATWLNAASARQVRRFDPQCTHQFGACTVAPGHVGAQGSAHVVQFTGEHHLIRIIHEVAIDAHAHAPGSPLIAKLIVQEALTARTAAGRGLLKVLAIGFPVGYGD